MKNLVRRLETSVIYLSLKSLYADIPTVALCNQHSMYLLILELCSLDQVAYMYMYVCEWLSVGVCHYLTYRRRTFNWNCHSYSRMGQRLYCEFKYVYATVRPTSKKSAVIVIIFSCVCPQRSVVHVEWKGSCRKNIYRVGHKGKVNAINL